MLKIENFQTSKRYENKGWSLSTLPKLERIDLLTKAIK